MRMAVAAMSERARLTGLFLLLRLLCQGCDAARMKPVSAPSSIVTIPLEKQNVPVVRNGRTVSHKTTYFGRVFVGMPTPQNFTVVFDSGSGHFLVPSVGCESETCLKHRRYDRHKSETAVDLLDIAGHPSEGEEDAPASMHDSLSLSFGMGKVEGTFVRDTLCFVDPVQHANDSEFCTPLRVVMATEMTPDPFGSFDFDGVLGLGLESLAVDPEFSLVGQLARRGKLSKPHFAYFLSRQEGVPSEISFGGHNPARAASELLWTDVHAPEEGYWQLKLQGVEVGGQLIQPCQDGNCLAIADTGTSLLGVPKHLVRQLHVALARTVPAEKAQADCRDLPGPELKLDLGGGLVIRLGPEDYSRPAPMLLPNNETGAMHVVCRASLLPVEQHDLGSEFWILGEPVLRKYYSVYDWNRKRVAFALAADVEVDAENATSAAAAAGNEVLPVPANA
eukprot:TRINITY_DN75201_c0_g1_i1.p1 TRINITY_DN75201_c0_g1~~TRINITY_DN75201_c0_g1_i1.p1  ORF type:complete len:449 (+),score=85.51 TRINITY_DN75201_c0_g1_i1:71-1417(+)